MMLYPSHIAELRSFSESAGLIAEVFWGVKGVSAEQELLAEHAFTCELPSQKIEAGIPQGYK
jgi:hypothetical protein